MFLSLGVVLLGGSCRPDRPGTRAASATWVTLKDCRFDPEGFYDGDSFRVICDGERFVFRLYFVDAPELDAGFSDRVREQCRYFGVTQHELHLIAERAKEFTAERLRSGFRVTTRWQDAMGRTKRYAAMVEVGGEDVGELLVREGLARVKGFRAVLPDGTSAKEQIAKLKRLEREAKRERKGAWAYSNKLDKPDPWQWVWDLWKWLSGRLRRRESEATGADAAARHSPRYTQRAVHVSATITSVSKGSRGLSRSQIQRATFSLVGFSRPGISLR